VARDNFHLRRVVLSAISVVTVSVGRL